MRAFLASAEISEDMSILTRNNMIRQRSSDTELIF